MASVTFSASVGGDGSTVTDDSNPNTGLANGGHRTRFVPSLAQLVAVASNTVTQATNASTSATLALNAPGTSATSTSSITIGTGSKSLTLAQTGKNFVVGQYVAIVDSTTTTNYMVGAITAFTSGTGAMTVNVTQINGSGTITAWAVTPTAPSQLPAQSGNAGKVLTTDGNATSWAPAGLPMVVVTGTTQAAVVGTHYVLTNVAATTVTLPASATAGDQVWVTVANGLTTNSVARNGLNIMSLAEDLTLDATYASAQLRYINATIGWALI